MALTRILATILAFSAILTACTYVASVDAPLPETKDAEVAKDLIGQWVIVDDGEVAILRIDEGPGNVLNVSLLYTEYGSENLVRGLPYVLGKWRAVPTIIDGRVYYSALLEELGVFPDDDPEMGAWRRLASASVYHLGWAELSENELLTLHLLGENDLQELGVTFRQVDPDVEDVRIATVDPERLRDFILARGDDKVFTWELGAFARIAARSPSEALPKD